MTDNINPAVDNHDETAHVKKKLWSKGKVIIAGVTGLALIVAGSVYGVHRYNQGQAEERAKAEATLEIAVGVAAGTVAYGKKVASTPLPEGVSLTTETESYTKARDKVTDTLKKISYVKVEESDLSGEPIVGDPYAQGKDAVKPGVIAAYNDLNFGVFKAVSNASDKVSTSDMTEIATTLTKETKTLATEIANLVKAIDETKLSTAKANVDGALEGLNEKITNAQSLLDSTTDDTVVNPSVRSDLANVITQAREIAGKTATTTSEYEALAGEISNSQSALENAINAVNNEVQAKAAAVSQQQSNQGTTQTGSSPKNQTPKSGTTTRGTRNNSGTTAGSTGGTRNSGRSTGSGNTGGSSSSGGASEGWGAPVTTKPTDPKQISTAYHCSTGTGFIHYRASKGWNLEAAKADAAANGYNGCYTTGEWAP